MSKYFVLTVMALGLLAATACRSRRGAAPAPGQLGYFDAAAYLPTFPPLPEEPAPAKASDPVRATLPRPQPLQARNAQVEAWLDTVQARNQRIKYARGYRLQVYSGSDRAAAMASKETLYRRYPGTEAYLTYNLPNFRLLAGDYLSRLEAQLAARRLSRDFASPLIVPGQVRIR